MDISAAAVKELRERTGVGFMDCKHALREASGDIDEAIKILRTMGKAKAAKKAGRAATEGRIESYVHMGGKIAVLLELNCETDFVARNEDFVSLARDLAMHVAAANPKHIAREDVDAAALDSEREVYREQALSEGKPENIIDKIVDGKVNRYLAETCLLEQGFVKEPDRKVTDLITDAVTKLGENIRIGRFSRLAIGDSDATLAVRKPVSTEE
ncbi:MAG TPA: translation elongation factor Ts [Acidobacteriota bacterium]|nr:translation elongation factor Ts [Acidobacteriota bacterium]